MIIVLMLILFLWFVVIAIVEFTQGYSYFYREDLKDIHNPFYCFTPHWYCFFF